MCWFTVESLPKHKHKRPMAEFEDVSLPNRVIYSRPDSTGPKPAIRVAVPRSVASGKPTLVDIPAKEPHHPPRSREALSGRGTKRVKIVEPPKEPPCRDWPYMPETSPIAPRRDTLHTYNVFRPITPRPRHSPSHSFAVRAATNRALREVEREVFGPPRPRLRRVKPFEHRPEPPYRWEYAAPSRRAHRPYPPFASIDAWI